MNFKKLIYSLLIGVSGFVLGYLSTQYEYFEIETKFGAFDALNLIVTIFFGLFIAYIVDKRKSESRVEKDMILSKSSQLELAINKIQFHSNNRIELTTATSIFKECGMLLFQMIEMTDIARISVSRKDFTEIKETLDELKGMMTNTPKTSEATPIPVTENLKVDEGIIVYSYEYLLSIENKIRTFKRLIFESQIKINRG